MHVTADAPLRQHILSVLLHSACSFISEVALTNGIDVSSHSNNQLLKTATLLFPKDHLHCKPYYVPGLGCFLLNAQKDTSLCIETHLADSFPHLKAVPYVIMHVEQSSKAGWCADDAA